MKRVRTLALTALLIGLGACASTSKDRYYVSGNEQGGDYYLAPAPRGDLYGSYFGGYCPWRPFGCGFGSDFGFGYDDWRFFSFGYRDSPWWGDSPYFYAPPPPRHRHSTQTQTGAWPNSPADAPSRYERTQDGREPSRTQPSRSEPLPIRTEPHPGREKRDGRPPAGI